MGSTDSKLAFRKSVFRLYEQSSIPESEAEFWELFFNLPDSIEDCFSLFSPQDVRKIRDDYQSNLASLITKCSEKIFKPDDLKHVLNAVRLLTRLFPYVFEDEALEDRLFWNSDNDFFAERLLRGITELLFMPGFTLPDSLEGPYPVWESGIGCTIAPSSTKVQEQNRLEVLRLFLVLMSKSMYITPSETASKVNKWCKFCVTSLDRDVCLSLLCSLLNVIINYNPYSWIPYDHVFLADLKENLVQVCSGTLIVLLNYTTGLKDFGDPSIDFAENVPLVPNPNDRRPSIEKVLPDMTEEELRNTNKFRFYLARLHRQKDFSFILDGLCLLLSNPLQANTTYLPNSVRQVNLTEEILMLFWKLIEVNKDFFKFVCNNEKCLEILSSLIFHVLSNKGLTVLHSKIGLVRMCAFILHTLTGERNFSVLLNKPWNLALPGGFDLPSFKGNYADLLVLTLYVLIYTAKGRLSTLYDCFFTIIANISPYVKSFSVVTSNKLLVMFKTFSDSSFLLSRESNHILIFFLLDAFNNIIQYQFDGNPHLVYELLRHKQLFFDLRDLKFSKTRNLWNEMQQKKKEKLTARMESLKLNSNEPVEEEIENSAEDVETEPAESPKEKEQIAVKSSSAPASPLSGNENSGNQINKPPVLQKDVSKLNTPPEGVIPQIFIPHEKWFTYWHQQLPLQTIISLLETLAPQMEQMCQEENLNDEAVVAFLQSGTLVGLLPVPHAIFVRKFQYTEGIHIWFTSYMWGVSYLRHTSPNPSIWIGSKVKLFEVKSID